MIIADKKFLAEIDAKAEALKQTILNSKSEVTYTGTAYYVSNSGNDLNDGLTPETAINSLDRINTLPLKSGDAILLERGGMWRGSIHINISGITVSAYGEGAKPIINGSRKNYAVDYEWVKTDYENIWKYTYPIGMDVCHIVCDGNVHCVKKCFGHYGFSGKPEDLKYDLEYFSDYNDHNFLYFYSEENPGKRFKVIEMSRLECGVLVRCAGDVRIDNIHVENAFFGVSSGAIKNLHISNCVFGVIGGGGRMDKNKTAFTRLGNGVEMYGECDGFIVENCYFHDVYDAGVTHQKKGANLAKPIIMENVTYANNLFEHCIYSIEYFCDQKGDFENEAIMRHIRMNGNICRYAGGFGWQRPDRVARHIQGGWLNNKRMYPAEDFIVENNIFDRSINTLISISAKDEKHLPVMRGNTYIQYADGLYGLCDVPYDHYEKFDENIENYIKVKKNEPDAVVAIVPENDGLSNMKPDVADRYYYPADKIL